MKNEKELKAHLNTLTKDELIELLLQTRFEKNLLEMMYDTAVELCENQAKSEWIPVSERLPEKEESVIVTVKDDSADSPIYYTSTGWYYEGMWIVENTVCYQVTAWMSLPEPYEE